MTDLQLYLDLLQRAGFLCEVRPFTAPEYDPKWPKWQGTKVYLNERCPEFRGYTGFEGYLWFGPDGQLLRHGAMEH